MGPGLPLGWAGVHCHATGLLLASLCSAAHFFRCGSRCDHPHFPCGHRTRRNNSPDKMGPNSINQHDLACYAVWENGTVSLCSTAHALETTVAKVQAMQVSESGAERSGHLAAERPSRGNAFERCAACFLQGCVGRPDTERTAKRWQTKGTNRVRKRVKLPEDNACFVIANSDCRNLILKAFGKTSRRSTAGCYLERYSECVRRRPTSAINTKGA